MIQSFGKKLVLLSMLFILIVGTLLFTLFGTEPGTRWLIQRVVSIESLGISVEAVEGTLLGRLSLKNFRYRSTTEAMTLDTFDFIWEPSALLTGTLHVQSIRGANLLFEMLEETKEPAEDVSISIPEIPLAISIDAFDLRHFRFISNGTETIVKRVQLAADLKNQEFRLTRLVLQTPELNAQAHGEVRLVRTLPMNAQLAWTLQLPEQPEITGKTAIQGDLQKLAMTGTIGGAVILTHIATIEAMAERPSINLTADWQQLQWPLSGAAHVSSHQGQIILAGTLENYRIDLTSQVAAEQLPPIDVKFSGQGNTESLHIEKLKLAPNQGRLDVSGQVSWADHIGFDMQVTAEDINPANFIKEVPGSLNLQAGISGQIIADRFKGNVDIKRLDGKLQGYPINASGNLALDGNQVLVDRLVVQSAKNRLSANGRLTPAKAQFEFEVKAPKLATVWPGLAGSIEGQGSIQGDYRNPVVAVELTADRLSFQGNAIQHLKLDVDYAEALSRPSTINLAGRGLNLSGQLVDRLTLEGTGSIARHRFQSHIHSAEVKVDLGIIGGFENNRWEGAIKQLALDHHQLHRWQLADSWLINVEQLTEAIYINMQPGCLLQGAASLCLSLNGITTERLEASADARSMELGLFKPWLPDDLGLTGSLTAELNALKQGETLDASLRLQIPKAVASLTRPNEAPFEIPLSETNITARYQHERVAAEARIGLGGTDYLSAGIETGRLTKQKPLPLSGVIQASITDMSFIDALVPEIEKLKGKFSANLIIAGDSESPLLIGSCGLSEAGMSVPIAGISVKNIDLKFIASAAQPDRLQLTGHANSGKGALDLAGTLDLNEAQGFPVSIQINGNDFEVAKLPQAEITVSPELRVMQLRNRTEISGDVKVDKANLKITEIPESAVAPSEDEVIVGAEVSTDSDEKVPEVASDINIILGDKVHFSGYGLTTRLNGKLRYTGSVRQQRMQGRVAMSDAKYKAYGQDLTLTKGEFLFNGPADNPWLNIEARRKAVGEDVTAILRVTGPLKSPETSVTTEPTLPESEALAYLLTGRSLQRVGESQSNALAKAAFSYGAGQLSWLGDQMGIDEVEVEEAERLEDSAVRLGKYINPDLYVGLSLGFFSNNYAVLFKQQLSKHFSLQTRAGESQRIDLKYQLDTD
ncbi:MAG: translocation/assembly module TamB domain-containing protein [Gammaproteobacteria bacterium]